MPAPHPLTHSLIPDLIRHKSALGKNRGTFHAAILILDLSGFTALTETLMRQSKDGAEVLSATINEIFDPMVGTVYAHGGFISTFAGDAFTAFFPLQNRWAARHAAQVALTIQQFFAARPVFHTRYGDFALSMRIGLAFGPVEWGLIAAHPAVFYFRGSAIDRCAEANELAPKGGIFAEKAIVPFLADWLILTPAESEHHRLDAALQPIAPRPSRPVVASHFDAAAFIPQPVLDFAAGETPGEFRSVAPVFISFQPGIDLDKFVKTVSELAGQYGGYLNKLDFGDKGGLLLLLFGAPLSYENDLARAANFLLALRQAVPEPTWRSGLALGTVYAGLVGGKKRREYTALGDVLNLAARLMAGAAWGEMLVSALAGEKLAALFTLGTRGERSFKGKSVAQQVYALEERKTAEGDRAFSGQMFGRAREQEQLSVFAQPLYRQQFAGYLTVYGEPGLGKSRLIHAFRQGLESAKIPHLWLYGQTDQTLRQSLNPIHYALRTYFGQQPGAPIAENLPRFEAVLAELAASAPEELRRELERVRPFLAALAGLNVEMPVVNARLRFQNSLFAVKTLVQAESLRRPVFVVVEDIHWLDGDTAELLRVLTRNVAGYPFALICTSRYQDDGSKPAPGLDPDVPTVEIDLNYLTPEDVSLFAGQVLSGGPVAAELQAFLQEKTNGNPFFVEQLALDLVERGLLAREKGIWQLQTTELNEVPENIHAVLVARVDRLSAQVRRVVQVAAVLGHEFEVQVLSSMLKNEQEVPIYIQQAERETIWSALSEVRYIFKHALLRDAVYDMQLRARLRELHALAASTIEQVHTASGLVLHYADLAYHCDHAEQADEAVKWYLLAAKHSASLYANAEAEAALARALELVHASDLEKRFVLHLEHQKILDVLAQRDKEEKDMAALLEVAQAMGEPDKLAKAFLSQALFCISTDDYPGCMAAAQSALQYAHQAGDMESELWAYLRWGEALRYLGELAEATEKIDTALKMARAADLKEQEALSLYDLGDIYQEQGNYPRAKECARRMIDLHHELENLSGEARGLNILGIIADMTGEYDEAQTYFAEMLRISRQLGDRLLESVAITNLGNVAYFQGDYGQAQDCFARGLALKREIRDRRGESIALSNIANILSIYGYFAECQSYVEQALQISRETGDQETVADTLSGLGSIYLTLENTGAAWEYLSQALDLSQKVGNYETEEFAITTLGHYWLKMGDLQQATEMYTRALEMQKKAGRASAEINSLANLAQVSLQKPDLAEAQGHLAGILAFLEQNSAESIEYPLPVFWTCHQVLKQTGDARAAKYLELAYQFLSQLLKKAPDEQSRRSLVENIPLHREILAAWEAKE